MWISFGSTVTLALAEVCPELVFNWQVYTALSCSVAPTIQSFNASWTRKVLLVSTMPLKRMGEGGSCQ